MKYSLLLALLCVTFLKAQTPCDNNSAAGFPCDGYTLMSNIPLSAFNAQSGNDSWGWTDPLDGTEYVIMGLNNGTAFIDISDPINPVYLGKLPSNGQDNLFGNWRDMKVYNDHVFIVSEIRGHGMQVFDLTKLRDVTNPPETFVVDAQYDGFSFAHNIAINEDTGYAYGLGTDTFSGGGHFVNIQDPTNPVAAGGHGADGYSHDAQVVVYEGPDPDYQGREIYVGSNENEVVFVDVTDKSNPQNISSIDYSNVAYTHQGWFTENQQYFVVTDEIDEIIFGNELRLIIMDMTDLDNPVEHMQYLGETPAVDHNVYVHDDKAYLSAYTAGMRVIDMSDIDNKVMDEVGFFDTWPADDNTSASIGDPGAWNVYPFFASKNLVITNFSDNGGLFIVRDPNALSVTEEGVQEFAAFPNPTKDNVTIQSNGVVIANVSVFDVTGKLLMTVEGIDALTTEIDMTTFSSGIYLARINDVTTMRLVKR